MLDLLLSKGILGLVLLAFLAAFLLMVVLAPILWAVAAWANDEWDPSRIVQEYWNGLAWMFWAPVEEGPWQTQVSMMVFGIIAMLFTSVIIWGALGVASEPFINLRDKGGRLVSKDHTVLIGWSHLGYRVLNELAIANEKRGKSQIAVLNDGPRSALEDDIRGRLSSRGTKVFVRPGSTKDPKDFDRVCLNAARDVVVLGDWDSDDHDSQIIASLLALARYREAHPEFDADVVACVKDPENVLPARVAAKYPASIFDFRTMLGRITLQSARLPGLLPVLTDLLGFEGDELHAAAVPRFVGREFRELARYFPTSTPVGLVRDGSSMLDPDQDTVVQAGDRVVFITADERSVAALDNPIPVDDAAIVPASSWSPSRDGESWLFVGWSGRLREMLGDLDSYLEGATNRVTIVARDDDMEDADELADSAEWEHLRVDTAKWSDGLAARDMLLGADVGGRTYVVISSLALQGESDDEALRILLVTRDILSGLDSGSRGPIVVSELIDARNRKICDVADVKDILVTSDLVSLMLAQLCENPALLPIFEDILDAEGSEIYLKPVELYLRTGVEVGFATMATSAAARGEIAIGYRLATESSDPDKNFGVHVNPDKSRQVVLRPGDSLVVISPDERIEIPASQPTP